MYRVQGHYLTCRGYTVIICEIERVHGQYVSCRGFTVIICHVEGIRSLYVIYMVHGHYMSG